MKAMHTGTNWQGVLTAVCVMAGPAQSAWSAPQLIDLGVPPGASGVTVGDMSADGTTVVGFDSGQASTNAFRWRSTTGNQTLGTPAGSTRSYAWGANADGSVVVGEGAESRRAFRWTALSGMQELAPLPGHDWAGAYDVSADGAKIVGYSTQSGSGPRAVWWSADGQTHDMGTGVVNSFAAAVSGDGSVIVGTDDPNLFRWTNETGLQVIPIPDGWVISYVFAVNQDGSKIVGTVIDAGITLARTWLWTALAGTRLLPPVQGFEFATKISADGSLIAGSYRVGVGQELAALWHPAIGGVALNEYLPQIGVDMDGWVLRDVAGISADGSILSGSGTHNGLARAWLLTGFTPVNLCPADLNHDALAEDADFVIFAAEYEILDCADPAMILWCPADLNHDGFVDDSDFVLFANAYDELVCP